MRNDIQLGEGLWLEKTSTRHGHIFMEDRLGVKGEVTLKKFRDGDDYPYEVCTSPNTVTLAGASLLCRMISRTGAGSSGQLPLSAANTRIKLYNVTEKGVIATPTISRPTTESVKWTFIDASNNEYGQSAINELRVYNDATTGTVQFNQLTGLPAGYATYKKFNETWQIDYTLTLTGYGDIIVGSTGNGTDRILDLLTGASVSGWDAASRAQIVLTDAPSWNADTQIAQAAPDVDTGTGRATWVFVFGDGVAQVNWFNFRVGLGPTMTPLLRMGETDIFFGNIPGGTTKSQYDIWTLTYKVDAYAAA